MNKYLLYLLFLICPSVVFAQQKCGHVPYLDYLETQSPGIGKAIDSSFMTAVHEANQKTKAVLGGVYQINVVFHLVYNNEGQNVSDARIMGQLALLNSCFRRTTSDTGDTRDIFKNVAEDSKIEFVLATTDPDGNPTNGIVRKQSDVEYFGGTFLQLEGLEEVKKLPDGSPSWDTDKYLNIWICDMSDDGFEFVLGYAFPPLGAPHWGNEAKAVSPDMQGVVVHYSTVGGLVTDANKENGSKTLVHEVGHYLGLRHIWGDGGCSKDDFIEDTPQASEETSFCDFNKNTCTQSGRKDLPDMVENYMDYSPDICLNMFTSDQVKLMRANMRKYRSNIFVDASGRFVAPEPFVSFAVLLYPNPTSDEITVVMSGVQTDQDYRLRIVNTLGQQCFSIPLVAIKEQLVKGLQGLSGPYIYQILQGDRVLEKGKILIGI